MMLPSGRGPALRQCPEIWRTVRYALEDWGRTARFCLIMLVMFVPPTVVFWSVRR
jgi:hypothetical protein